MDSWTADDSCGEGCAQLDDFNWFLPADDRVGDLPAPESQVDVSDSESEVDYVEPDSAPMQITTTAVEVLCPPVVTQTRPKEGLTPAVRRGRDLLTEDGTLAVDTRQVSIASDTDVVSGIHMISECIPTVTPIKIGCGTSGCLGGHSDETSRLLLHELAPAGGRECRVARCLCSGCCGVRKGNGRWKFQGRQ